MVEPGKNGVRKGRTWAWLEYKKGDVKMKFTDKLSEPLKNENPAIWDLVMDDMKQRDCTGLERYGTRLRAYNGRDSLIDAYQEALDLAVYLRQSLFEKYGE